MCRVCHMPHPHAWVVPLDVARRVRAGVGWPVNPRTSRSEPLSRRTQYRRRPACSRRTAPPSRVPPGRSRTKRARAMSSLRSGGWPPSWTTAFLAIRPSSSRDAAHCGSLIQRVGSSLCARRMTSPTSPCTASRGPAQGSSLETFPCALCFGRGNRLACCFSPTSSAVIIKTMALRGLASICALPSRWIMCARGSFHPRRVASCIAPRQASSSSKVPLRSVNGARRRMRSGRHSLSSRTQ